MRMPVYARGRRTVRAVRNRATRAKNSFKPLLFAAFFLLGAAAGTILGVAPDNPLFTEGMVISGSGAYLNKSFFEILLSCAVYHFMIAACATSILGVALIPLVFALRGFSLACSAAFLALAFPGKGLILTAIILGLPSLLTVPSLFFLGSDGLALSARLVSLLRRRPYQPEAGDAGGSLVVSGACICIATAIRYSIVPILTALII